MSKVPVIIEHAGGNYSAYSPLLKGCVATGLTLTEIKKEYASALNYHLESMRDDNDEIPAIFQKDFKLEFSITPADYKTKEEIIHLQTQKAITQINQMIEEADVSQNCIVIDIAKEKVRDNVLEYFKDLQITDVDPNGVRSEHVWVSW
jgi:predicted RNase H-like HicB family nuclease